MQIYSRNIGSNRFIAIWMGYLITVYLLATVLVNRPELGTLVWGVEMYTAVAVGLVVAIIIPFGLRRSVSTYSCTDVGIPSVWYDPNTGISHGEATH